MVGGIWQRLRSMLGGQPPRAEPAARPQPYLPELPYVAKENETASQTPTAPLQAIDPPRSVEQLVESLSNRLTEDESLRSSLTDDEFRPLLDWSARRIGELARSCASLSPAAAEAQLQLAGSQLFDLLRLVDLAVGQRDGASPDLVTSRLQMVDTLLAPPLFELQAAGRARARLEALLAEPPERLRSADGADLARRIVAALS